MLTLVKCKFVCYLVPRMKLYSKTSVVTITATMVIMSISLVYNPNTM